MTMSNEVKALLGPVPWVHLEDAREVCATEGKVAFATRAWEVFRDLEAGTPVLIYASRSGLPDGTIPEPKEQFRHPYVTWLARFVGYVDAVGGAHPAGRRYRPPSTVTDHEADTLGYYEVADLRALPREDWVPIERLSDADGRPYPQAFIPEGPIVVTWKQPVREPEGPAVPQPPPTAPIEDQTEETWSSFAQSLASGLGRMRADQYLVIDVAPRPDGGEVPNYFVQFACGGEEGFRAEAVSNRYLADRWKLPEKGAETLFRLGWSAPEPDAEPPRGKVNFWRDWSSPPPLSDMAQMAVSTLRRVYGVTSTDQLQYRYFDKGGTDLELADLGLRRDPLKGRALDQGVEHLRPIVEKALKEALNAGELKYDEQGDIPVRFGSAMVFVRLLGGPQPMVRVFSPLLWELSNTAGLLEAVNDINTRISIGRVFWTGDNVVAAIDLPAPGLSGEYVSMACFEIGSLADHFDEELAQRFGGKTMFGQASAAEPPAAPGYL